jgi:hypothetical protein
MLNVASLNFVTDYFGRPEDAKRSKLEFRDGLFRSPGHRAKIRVMVCVFFLLRFCLNKCVDLAVKLACQGGTQFGSPSRIMF